MVALAHSMVEEGQASERRADRLVLERRIFGRQRVNVHADARRLDHSVAARREPRLRVHILDLSLGGLAAISASRLERGECVSVSFPPNLGQRGWNAYGRVIRCESVADGYKLAVEFETLPAA